MEHMNPERARLLEGGAGATAGKRSFGSAIGDDSAGLSKRGKFDRRGGRGGGRMFQRGRGGGGGGPQSSGGNNIPVASRESTAALGLDGASDARDVKPQTRPSGFAKRDFGSAFGSSSSQVGDRSDGYTNGTSDTAVSSPLKISKKLGTIAQPSSFLENVKLKQGQPRPTLPKISSEYERLVFTHSSISLKENYERLEFLGDAFLELAASRLIFYHYPNFPPSRLSSLRQQLVQNSTLAEYSQAYGFDTKLRTKKSETYGEGGWTKVMGDVFEAYVAAVVLSNPEVGNLEMEKWMAALWADRLLGSKEANTEVYDYGDATQELHRLLDHPGSRLVIELEKHIADDREGTQTYHVVAKIEDRYGKQLLGRGSGLSLREAKQDASLKALSEKNAVFVQVAERKVKWEAEYIEKENQKSATGDAKNDPILAFDRQTRHVANATKRIAETEAILIDLEKRLNVAPDDEEALKDRKDRIKILKKEKQKLEQAGKKLAEATLALPADNGAAKQDKKEDKVDSDDSSSPSSSSDESEKPARTPTKKELKKAKAKEEKKARKKEKAAKRDASTRRSKEFKEKKASKS